MATLFATAGLLIWRWDEPTDLVSGALRLDDLAIAISLIAILSAGFAVLLSIREPAAEAGGLRRVPRAAARLGAGDGAARPGAEPGHPLRRDRDALDPALHPLRDESRQGALARVGAEVPDRRLARLGDAALRARLHLRRLGLDRLRRDRRRDLQTRHERRLADSGRDRAGRGRARVQDLDRPLPPVDSRRLRGGADPDHRVHGGRDQGGGVRRLRPLLRRRPDLRGLRLAAGAGGAGGDLDRRRQRRRPRPELAEAAARLLGDRPGRLHPRRPRGGDRSGRQRARLLPRRPTPS